DEGRQRTRSVGRQEHCILTDLSEEEATCREATELAPLPPLTSLFFPAPVRVVSSERAVVPAHGPGKKLSEHANARRSPQIIMGQEPKAGRGDRKRLRQPRKLRLDVAQAASQASHPQTCPNQPAGHDRIVASDGSLDRPARRPPLRRLPPLRL